MTDLSTILFCLARINLKKKKPKQIFFIDWKKKNVERLYQQTL